MKYILVICSLFLISTLTYAKTCPPPPAGYLFRVAAWGNHKDITSQIRCHYYNTSNGNISKMIETYEYYHEMDMLKLRWSAIGEHYYLCTGTDVNNCSFGRR